MGFVRPPGGSKKDRYLAMPATGVPLRIGEPPALAHPGSYRILITAPKTASTKHIAIQIMT